ncbi:MAG: hypothetical protein AAGA36_00150 [Pseudomonadota bacterium]
MKYLILFAALWATPAAAQVCGNLPIGDAREDCRLEKIGRDIREADLAGSRARAEVDRLVADIVERRATAQPQPDPTPDPAPVVDPVPEPDPVPKPDPVTSPMAASLDFDLTVSGAVTDTVTIGTELDTWIDGTRVFASPLDGGFYLMAWVHPDHIRLVAGLDGRALRVEDGGTAVKTGPVNICFRQDGQDLACHDLDGFVTGQEIHHEIGERAYISTPTDAIEAGLWPRHDPFLIIYWNRGAKDWAQRFAKPGKLNKLHSYAPLKASGWTQPWMPQQGIQQAVHSTFGWASWAMDPDSEHIDQYKQVIQVSAQDAAGQIWHRMDGYAPPDLRKDYFTQATFRSEFPLIAGNLDDFEEDTKKRHGWMMDGTHLNAPGWEMYLLTGDPYYLRQWQLAVTQPVLLDDAGWRQKGFEDGKAHAVINRSQPRGYGKQLMLLLRLIEVMPEGEWDWLVSREALQHILDETGKQALWLAQTPGMQAGAMPRSWKGERVHGWGFGHSDAQALWSVGWAVHLGYEDFRPLYEAYRNAVHKYWDAFGVAMTRAGQFAGNDLDRTLDQALADALKNPKAPQGGPMNPIVVHQWREERLTGIFAALSQWFPEDWTEIAEGWKSHTREYQQWYASQKWSSIIPLEKQVQSDVKAEKWSGPALDWQFAIGP